MNLLQIKSFCFDSKVNTSLTNENDASFFTPQLANDVSMLSYQLETSSFFHDCPEKSKSSTATKELKEFISSIHTSISTMNLTQRDTDCIYDLLNNFTNKTKEFYVSSLESNSTDSISDILDQSSEFIKSELNLQSSVYRRTKKIIQNKCFVNPKELAISLRWEQVKAVRFGKKVFVPRLIQSTFQFVSIVETLVALFKDKDFRDAYFRSNAENNHVCRTGIYSDFCCGSTFKQKFFEENKNCIKLQIYADEFDPCSALQSKAGIHKTLGVYFSIRNIPLKFQSKLKNIYLVCLCNGDDLKTKSTDCNNIWRPIVRDIAYLEEVGITVGDNQNIKGTLTNLSFDNLEANTALGFAGSFSASYYCRFCMLSKTECQTTTVDDAQQHRSKSDYQNQLQTVQNSEKVNFSETKGVKYHCVLNELRYFNVIDNPTCDVMHDHNEGSIPYLLKSFLDLCFKLKLFSADQLDFMFQFHNYGWLNRKNKPSAIHVIDRKRSLGQNATQSICLFRNLPFVLFKFKLHPKLSEWWECIQLLLQFLVIVYSYEISEEELITLEATTNQFLKQIRKCIEEPLIPKLHFMLHYPSIIRKVGPVMFMNTIRYEAMHQIFKNIANKTKNFRNIYKTMAVKHQQQMCVKGSIFHDEIDSTKEKKLDPDSIDEFSEILLEFCKNLKDIREVELLRCNNFEYQKNILVIQKGIFHYIHRIFVIHDEHHFLCKPYEVLSFDNFLNSYKVQEDSQLQYTILKFASLQNKRPYETKILNREEFVIEEDLEIRQKCVLNF